MADTPAGGAGEGGFKARAGALTLFYLASPMDRGTLLKLLAEATTGAQVVEMVTHALAAGPLTAVETQEAIQVLDLETVEARLEAMEEAGQLETLPGPDGEPRYAVTEWLRASRRALRASPPR